MASRVRDPLFIADWLDVIFVHFTVDRDRLQRLVPLPLDLHDGQAYVSLVAFTQSGLRPVLGGPLAALLLAPLARHGFLNVRTYVRHRDTRGIFFLAEWIPNRLAAFIGPRTYGLPYRVGRLRYRHMRRDVCAQGRKLTLEADSCTAQTSTAADTFLLERYTAFTCRNGVVRRFDVDHAPWIQRPVDVRIVRSDLLGLSGDWIDGARFAAAQYSPGVRDVIIGHPVVVSRNTDGRHSLDRRGGVPTVSAISDQ